MPRRRESQNPKLVVADESESGSSSSSSASLNTELQPAPSLSYSKCTLCTWLERRIANTIKEQIKHMEKYHVA